MQKGHCRAWEKKLPREIYHGEPKWSRRQCVLDSSMKDVAFPSVLNCWGAEEGETGDWALPYG
jgi:hypothetical protein